MSFLEENLKVYKEESERLESNNENLKRDLGRS
jgi:hypothetical protein